MHDPVDAVIAVTFRCNAHCAMCNIWRSRREDALRPEHLDKLPASLRTINLSGGEPFCRDDLDAFVRHARRRCPRATITISTNAYTPDRIVSMMADIRRIDPAVRLAVSLDGIGPAHDRIRGDAGAFDAAVQLIDRLTADGYRRLRLGMTVSRDNVEQLAGVAELAARRGLELGVVAAHAAETHLGVSGLPAPAMPPHARRGFERLCARWLRTWRPKLWLRAHFAAGTYRRLARRPWRVRCRAGEDFVFLQADGTVYSCSVRGRALGNLIEQDWTEIARAPAVAGARQAARHCPERCWMICTARSAYRRRPWAAGGWIALNKLRAHLRLLRLRRPYAPEDSPGADCSH
ncbi:MAG: radical SAM protein [Phycisphaerae bacterium]|nr:radical SAM protein [Phycisphaerae bacterium]